MGFWDCVCEGEGTKLRARTLQRNVRRRVVLGLQMCKGESDRRQAINRAGIFRAVGEIGSTMNYGFQCRTPANSGRTMSSDKGACISCGCQAMRCNGDCPPAVRINGNRSHLKAFLGWSHERPILEVMLRLSDSVHCVGTMSFANGLLSNAARLQNLEQEYRRLD
jgi:hypothetical protein